ncbi:BTB domain-containing protein [Mycena indigotica]|uniref:BTB domain-containing protein n=1 Tax=Mycena indigotica TaxID=2126181 RepID=A0A8H6SPK3_9AGAR|nr:BTB domain-containing protein [Mycena indigotica]KAF7303493.1 BTB domain-containing protein [Mycena indigotica]
MPLDVAHSQAPDPPMRRAASEAPPQVTLWQFGGERLLNGKLTLPLVPLGTATPTPPASASRATLGPQTTYLYQVVNPSPTTTVRDGLFTTETVAVTGARTIVASASGWYEPLPSGASIQCSFVNTTYGECFDGKSGSTTLANRGKPTPVVLAVSIASSVPSTSTSLAPSASSSSPARPHPSTLVGVVVGTIIGLMIIVLFAFLTFIFRRRTRLRQRRSEMIRFPCPESTTSLPGQKQWSAPQVETGQYGSVGLVTPTTGTFSPSYVQYNDSAHSLYPPTLTPATTSVPNTHSQWRSGETAPSLNAPPTTSLPGGEGRDKALPRIPDRKSTATAIYDEPPPRPSFASRHDRQMEEEETAARPLKRARSDSPLLNEELPQRNTDFYFESDTLCVIRVEQTLFRVHRYLLIQASPIFANLFELPQGNLVIEGTSDANPIVLPDSAADFASLLKYLYRSASDAGAQDIPVSELHNVFGVARLSHKYEMASWQKWAARCLRELVSSSGAVFSSEDFVEAYDLAYRLPDQNLPKKLWVVWWKRVADGQLPIVPALDAGEKHNHRSFLASLYELELATLPMGNAAPVLSFPGFKPVHIQRIFVGHWSLSNWWTQFTETIPVFPITSERSCQQAGQHVPQCTANYARIWRDAYTAAAAKYPSTSQVRQRVVEMTKSFTSPQISGTLCRYKAGAVDDPLAKATKALSSYTNHFFAAENGLASAE